MLIVKVLGWARASGGLFPVACQPGTYARPADMGPDAMSQIKWARVKTLQRSLEKILRSYREACPLPPTTTPLSLMPLLSLWLPCLVSVFS